MFHWLNLTRGPVGIALAALLALSAGPVGAETQSSSAGTAAGHPDVDMHFRLNPTTVPTESRGPSTADHSRFEELQGPFTGGPDVTRACLSCHNEAGHQVMKTIHWTWEYTNPETGQKLGKKTLVNNFCTNARGNEGMCAQCHAGYGWKDESFDFGNAENIDCLVCHDRTGTYYRMPNSRGNDACAVMFEDKGPIDWPAVAQSVGLPGRENCGSCHFYGGGGDGVKHGDLDSSLVHADRSLDVHMDDKGADFACTVCHVSSEHQLAGSRYQMHARDTGGTGRPGLRRGVATCESCHGDAPHPMDSLRGMKLNGHVDRVACQTCHIPAIARGGVATIVGWDWRTAGRLRNGEGYKEHDYIQGNGEERATYKSIKGDFTYTENSAPEYAWFDGRMRYTTIDTHFDPAEQPIPINSFSGTPDDPTARIWPFKRVLTFQPYDKGNNTLVYMHLWGDDEDAYWGNYDFGRAIATGMESNGKPYSGEYGFIQTESWWPITHMVAPAENALGCGECHASEGRLASLTGFYMPGRGDTPGLDRIGLLALALAALGMAGHVLLRLLAARRRRGS